MSKIPVLRRVVAVVLAIVFCGAVGADEWLLVNFGTSVLARTIYANALMVLLAFLWLGAGAALFEALWKPRRR